MNVSILDSSPLNFSAQEDWEPSELLMSAKEFADAVNSGCLNEYDGSAMCMMTDGQMKPFDWRRPSIQDVVTVTWYGK